MTFLFLCFHLWKLWSEELVKRTWCNTSVLGLNLVYFISVLFVAMVAHKPLLRIVQSSSGHQVSHHHYQFICVYDLCTTPLLYIYDMHKEFPENVTLWALLLINDLLYVKKCCFRANMLYIHSCVPCSPYNRFSLSLMQFPVLVQQMRHAPNWDV